jgi:hypothetical protein
MTDPKPTDQALATRDAATVELVSPSSFNHYIADMQKRAHVLSPVTQIGSLPVMWKVVPAVVYINPDPAAGEVYQDKLFCKDGEVAVTKVGLRRIAQAGGMDTGARRLDDGRIQFFWSFEGYIRYRGFDGQMKNHTASVEWDLREDSEQVKRMVRAAEKSEYRKKQTPREFATKQIDAARLNGYRNAESRAINAAVREFGLRQKYTSKELSEKPFVVFNMVANPDMADPEQRRMVLAHALGGVNALYPPSAPSDVAALPAPNHATGTIIDAQPDDASAGEEGTPFQPLEGPKDQEPAEPTFLITDVRQHGDLLWLTTEETGTERLYLDSRPLAVSASKWIKKRVCLAIEKRGNDRWIVEITEPV